jgi:hypothetical protein
MAPFNGEMYFIARTTGGERPRLSAGATPALLKAAESVHYPSISAISPAA